VSDLDSGPDRPLAVSLRELHANLEITALLPVAEDANRWLGEAEAVAADAVVLIEAADAEDAPPAALETRLEQVLELLAEVETTGSADADEHVRAARDLAAELLAEL
jgi:hypothetical protein